MNLVQKFVLGCRLLAITSYIVVLAVATYHAPWIGYTRPDHAFSRSLCAPIWANDLNEVHVRTVNLWGRTAELRDFDRNQLPATAYMELNSTRLLFRLVFASAMFGAALVLLHYADKMAARI